MFKLFFLALLACACAWAGEPAAAPNDYADAATWLCRPGKRSACAEPQDATIVKADGSTSVEPFESKADAKIDCFYLYPTTSEDPTPNSDMIAGREIDATARQFGRFGSQCRQYAPLYRSITSRSLRARLIGVDVPGIDTELPYRDIVDAWNYYLAHDNEGRGFVLIGHSQGATLLIRLLQEHIEAQPVQRQLIAAIVPGHTVLVPAGKNVGGTFKSIPLCTQRNEFGCVVAYSTFRDTLPPSTDPGSWFGHSENGMLAACVNPATLGTDEWADLDTYMSKGTTRWTQTSEVTTPFVRVPGLVQGRCTTRGDFRYLEIHVAANPDDPRTDTIPGDIIVNGRPDPHWGLHPADISLVMGDLLKLVNSQGTAWVAANGSEPRTGHKKKKAS